MASKRKPQKVKKRKNSMKEVQYPGHYVFIKELRMRVKIKDGETVQDWIKHYCRSNIELRRSLYPAYNIKLV